MARSSSFTAFSRAAPVTTSRTCASAAAMRSVARFGSSSAAASSSIARRWSVGASSTRAPASVVVMGVPPRRDPSAFVERSRSSSPVRASGYLSVKIAR
ncbi:MAG: hypothetical protein QM820_16830 [Minicystis sp.]